MPEHICLSEGHLADTIWPLIMVEDRDEIEIGDKVGTSDARVVTSC